MGVSTTGARMAEVASPADIQILDNFIGGRWVKSQASE
jgi:hypothetical protein